MSGRGTVSLLVVSLIMNIGLTWKVRSIQESLQKVTQESWKSKAHPSVGVRVDDLAVTDVDGRLATLPMNAPGFEYTVLYVFRPHCSACKRNLPNLNSLQSQAGHRFRLVGLSTEREGLRAYVREQRFDFPVYALPEGMAPQALAIPGTPTTFVISNGTVGTVIASWLGAYNKQSKPEIERTLKIRLSN